MQNMKTLTIAVLGLALSGMTAIANDSTQVGGASINSNAGEVLLADSRGSKSSRRGRRATVTDTATEKTVRRSRNSARRGDRAAAQNSAAETAPAAASSDRVISRRGNRGATHTNSGDVATDPTHLERFLAGLFAPTSPWETAMVLVASERTGNQVWVDGIKPGPEGTFTGKIANDARVGQPDAPTTEVSFARVHIRDFGFVESGQGYGFVTLRDDDSAAEKTLVASFLAESAFPAGW